MKQKAPMINKFWLILTPIFLLVVGCQAQRKSRNLDWQEFVSSEGKFKVTFPGKPAKTAKEIEVSNGKLQSNRFEAAIVKPVIYLGA